MTQLNEEAKEKCCGMKNCAVDCGGEGCQDPSDWEESFDEEFRDLVDQDGMIGKMMQVKSFISQLLSKEREKGYMDGHADGIETQVDYAVELDRFIKAAKEEALAEVREIVEGMKKTLPKDPLDMTFREQMNQIVQPVYRPWVSNEESYNSALSDLLTKLSEKRS